jgi:hypothetical protein
MSCHCESFEKTCGNRILQKTELLYDEQTATLSLAVTFQLKI